MCNKGKQTYDTKYYNLDMIISIGFRVDSTKENMAITNWEKSPDGKILKLDITIAKNYLDEKELKNLNNLVNLFLDIVKNKNKKSV